MTPGTFRRPLADRGHDLYETPPEAVHALLKVENIPSRVWEPACGPGSIVRVLRERGRDVLATDLVQYYSTYQDAGDADFLIPGGVESRGQDRAIVTNPPYKLAHAFVRRALELSPYVAMLLRLSFLESERRRDILDEGCLARVHVFRNRLPMMHRAGWSGPKASSATAYAWFVWLRQWRGPAQINRISWEATQ
jgi:hypothetical protein